MFRPGKNNLNLTLDEYARQKKIRENLGLLEMRRRRAGAIDVDNLDFELDEITKPRHEPADYAENNISLGQYIRDAALTTSNSSLASSPTSNKFNRKSMRDDISSDEDEANEHIRQINDLEDVEMLDIKLKQEPLDDDEDKPMRKFVTVETANNIRVASQQWRLRQENLYPRSGMPRLGFVPKGPQKLLHVPARKRLGDGKFSRWSNNNTRNFGQANKQARHYQQAAEVHGTFVEKGNLSFKFCADDDENERIIAIDRKLKNAGRPAFVNRAITSAASPAPVNYITNNFYLAPNGQVTSTQSAAAETGKVAGDGMPKEDVIELFKKTILENMMVAQKQLGPEAKSTGV